MHSLTSAGRPYWTLFQARSRTLLQYRAAALAAVGTRVFWGVIRLMIYGGFYASTTSVQPLSEEQVAGYVWLGQAMLVMTLTWLDPEIRDMIRSGNVAYELVRPIELYWYWFARSVAARLVPTVVQGAPILLLVGPLLGLRPPPSLEAGALWVVSTVLALLLSSAIGTLMSVSLVWTISGEGVARLMPAFAYAFSGMAVPLLLWP
ncbi:MAG: ABC transporter permease, partial [Armatimonadetes bacterium]|nr:ABC transporter permease [Armatimonadota bacterium]